MTEPAKETAAPKRGNYEVARGNPHRGLSGTFDCSCRKSWTFDKTEESRTAALLESVKHSSGRERHIITATYHYPAGISA